MASPKIFPNLKYDPPFPWWEKEGRVYRVLDCNLVIPIK
jgi:hypothetical protein